MYNNQLANIEAVAFKDLKSLEWYVITFLLNIVIWIFSIKTLKLLIRLSLEFNQLTALPTGIFSFTLNLTYLDISKNKLHRLNASLFKGLSKLEMISIEGNQISSVDRNTFANLSQLQKVCFMSNPVSSQFPELVQDNICGHRTPPDSCEVLINNTCCPKNECEISLS